MRWTPKSPSGIVPASRRRAAARRCAADHFPRCGPRRCAGAARRTRPTDSGRRACRARSRAAVARDPRTDRRRGRSRCARRLRSPRRRRLRRRLREHVERVPRDFVSSISPPRIARATTADFEQVGPELGEDPALRDRLQLVAGASDALQSARDRLRALHLDDEVDGIGVRSRARGSTWRRGTGSGPPLASSSIRTRCSRASEPWRARATSSSASSFSRTASRSARRRLLTKTIVERCSRTSSSSAG